LKENLNYKIKIDIPNVVELISETFDGVLNHMFPGMLVFGGALRDIVAGFGLHHDLDIAASNSEGKKFIQHLEMSSKWVEECVVDQYKKQARIMEDKISDIVSPHSMANGALDLDRGLPYITKSKYGNMQGVRTFVNPFGRKLQIVTAKYDPFTLGEQSSISIVKAVDFICCGIMMDINGNVYEIIEGAKDDCVKKILRINKNADVKLHDLNKRIKKFVNRGWKSEINLAQIKRKHARLKKTAERETNKHPSNNTIQKHALLDGMIRVIINTSKMQTFERCSKSTTRTLELFYSILRNHGLNRAIHNCAVNVSYDNRSHIIISATGRNAESIARIEKALLYQEHKFSPKLKKKVDDSLFGETIRFITNPLPRARIHQNKAAPDHYSINWDTEKIYTSDISVTTSRTAGESAGWIGTSNVKAIVPDLEIFYEKESKKEKLTELGKMEAMDLRSKETSTQPETDSVVKNCSDLEITKEEKMKIEYGTNSIDKLVQYQGATKTERVRATSMAGKAAQRKCFTH
jgi:hypothetical protein